jgi:phenylacetate-coenzyme A ligase PaaK-like adenylate-forming protein
MKVGAASAAPSSLLRAGDRSVATGDSPPHDLLRNELIGQTVARAAALSPFYRRLYEQAGIDPAAIRHVRDLEPLPTVEKEQLRLAGREAQCWEPDTRVSHVQHTTGTTGNAFFTYRSVAETQFIRDFFSRANAARAVDDGTPTPIMLQIQVPYHGTAMPIPAKVFVLPFAVNEEQLVDYAIMLLRKEFDLPGVDSRASILSGDQTQIRAFTDYVLQRGFEPRTEFTIRLINLQGRHLTSRWRTILEETWGAHVTDRFSVSEVLGGAASCPFCAGYHFDPYVVPEVVDARGEVVHGEGTGSLVLTALFPFVQLQPMIRYRSGDLFAVREDACYAPRFEFQGRALHALYDAGDSRELLLTGVDVVDVLDALPDVNRMVESNDLTHARYNQATGGPRAHGVRRRTGGHEELTLSVELTFNAPLYAQHVAGLERRIREALLHRSSRLAARVAAGTTRLRIEFVAPGSLSALERGTPLWSDAPETA